MITEVTPLTIRQRVESELQQIKDKNGGVLYPEAVIEFARKRKTSELHKQFNWDDQEAAHQWRLQQARQLIAYVRIIPHESRDVRAFVSLKSDRYNGGGYRDIESVMTDADRRAELLEQAKSEANAWRRKYSTLKELAKVFEAIDEL